jgi:tetratricopeptide (TPR) repeat protein
MRWQLLSTVVELAMAQQHGEAMKALFSCILLFMVGPLAANNAFEQARTAALTNPAATIELFAAQQSVLSSTPAWHQRDWLVLASRAYTRLKRYAEAEQSLQKADALLSEGISKTDLLLAAGFVNFMQQKFQAASYWYQCSARINLPPIEQARVEMSLGQIAYMQGDLARAKANFEHSLTAAKLYQQAPLEALLQNNLGLVLWRQQQYQPAIARLRQAMYGYTQLKEQYSLQMASLNLLTVVTSQQDWPAFDRYARSITSNIDHKAPADLQNYLAFLQEIRQAKLPLSAQSQQKLRQLATNFDMPGLAHNAAQLLQQFNAALPAAELARRNPQQDLRLPNLEQICGPYKIATR